MDADDTDNNNNYDGRHNMSHNIMQHRGLGTAYTRKESPGMFFIE